MVGAPRRRWARPLPFIVGAASAAALVMAVYLSGPTVILPGGAVEVVPAYVNGTAAEGGPTLCQEHHDCGRAGMVAISFTVSGPEALTGRLHGQAALTVAIANAAALPGIQCSLNWPPSNCTVEFGALWYETSLQTGVLDLGSLQFGLAGANNIVPDGTWTLCLINWAPTPLSVTVDGPVVETPT